MRKNDKPPCNSGVPEFTTLSPEEMAFRGRVELDPVAVIVVVTAVVEKEESRVWENWGVKFLDGEAREMVDEEMDTETVVEVVGVRVGVGVMDDETYGVVFGLDPAERDWVGEGGTEAVMEVVGVRVGVGVIDDEAEGEVLGLAPGERD